MQINKIRHSLAHIMACAVQEIYPKVKFGIGPEIENGFYYDFDFPAPISENEIKKIEKRMKRLIKQNLVFKKKNITKSEAKKIFKSQTYKLELIKGLSDKTVSIYQIGNFIDLCKGPHIKSTKEINIDSFKLDKIAGAYWKGSEKNKMLTRIYGLAFETKKELEQYSKNQEEAEKRDHRKLGLQLDLFSFHEEAPGMPFWHHKGLIIFNTLVEHWRKIQSKYDYQEVKLPDMLDVKLWQQSGHYEHYKDSMFFSEGESKTMALRPMDCPGAILLYKEKLRSYKEMPIRMGELGTVFRNEKSGELHGLFRVQQITQDDAHIFITEDMIQSEVTTVLKIMEEIYKPFTMSKTVYLATKPDDAMGSTKIWNKGEKALANALRKNKIKYKIKEKDGAFYGPKIDIHINDSLGRTWQTGTIQLDFFMPERFNMKYIDKKGKKKTPVIVHRALMGSLERFIGILTEHYGGAFPLWLSPVQIWVTPINSSHAKYAKDISKKLKEQGFRVETKTESETVSKKIRNGEIQKIPYLLVVGDKELKTKKVCVRQRGKRNIETLSLTKLIKSIKVKIENKK